LEKVDTEPEGFAWGPVEFVDWYLLQAKSLWDASNVAGEQDNDVE